MVPPAGPLGTESVPTGVVYSVLLVFHVGCALIGFGALAMTGIQARRARRGPAVPGAEGVRRYFRPGINWAGRALYGVPVFGFSLIAASRGTFSTGDGFVVTGLLLWTLATVMAEAVVWPAERRIQEVVANGWESGGDDGRFAFDCRLVALSATVLSGLFVAAVVVMVARP